MSYIMLSFALSFGGGTVAFERGSLHHVKKAKERHSGEPLWSLIGPGGFFVSAALLFTPYQRTQFPKTQKDREQ